MAFIETAYEMQSRRKCINRSREMTNIIRQYSCKPFMKNKFIERQKVAAKQYHRSRRGDHFENGIRIFHGYNGANPNDLSWWDDVTFVLNDYRVTLAWVHPRMVYEDRIDEEVDRLTADLPYPDRSQPSTPIYKKMGRSRKKFVLWKQAPVAKSDWHAQWTSARQRVMQTADYQIEPYLTSRWCKYSRFVTLCAPLEVRNADDLRDLVALTKRLLKREGSIDEIFHGYRYTRADWEREGLHLAGIDLHVHRMV